MNKISNLKIFETTIYDRPMEFKSFFIDYNNEFKTKNYDEKAKEIKRLKKEFLKNRITMCEKYGFDGSKIIIPNDKFSKETGSYFLADEKIYSEKKDLIYVKKSKNIVLLKSDNPGIVIGYPVADDPVVIIEDKDNQISALAHCDLDKISKKVPVYMIKALKQEANSNVKNLKVYISSNLKEKNNKYYVKPKPIKENPKVWKDSVHKYDKNDKNNIKSIIQNLLTYIINQEHAIYNMLVKEGIDPTNITISDRNTYEDSRLYSARKAQDYHEPDLQGKFLVGAYYEGTFPNYKEEKGRTRTL